MLAASSLGMTTKPNSEQQIPHTSREGATGFGMTALSLENDFAELGAVRETVYTFSTILPNWARSAPANQRRKPQNFQKAEALRYKGKQT